MPVAPHCVDMDDEMMRDMYTETKWDCSECGFRIEGVARDLQASADVECPNCESLISCSRL